MSMMRCLGCPWTFYTFQLTLIATDGNRVLILTATVPFGPGEESDPFHKSATGEYQPRRKVQRTLDHRTTIEGLKSRASEQGVALG